MSDVHINVMKHIFTRCVFTNLASVISPESETNDGNLCLSVAVAWAGPYSGPYAKY